MSYLKEEAVHIDSIGETLNLRELAAVAQIAIHEVVDVPFEGMFVACKHGVKEWANMSIDELKDMISLRQAGEISAHIFRLSGLDEEKNSESGPSEGSSSD